MCQLPYFIRAEQTHTRMAHLVGREYVTWCGDGDGVGILARRAERAVSLSLKCFFLSFLGTRTGHFGITERPLFFA